MFLAVIILSVSLVGIVFLGMGLKLIFNPGSTETPIRTCGSFNEDGSGCACGNKQGNCYD